MTTDLVVIGAGGFGREVIDVADAMNAVEPTWNLLGVVDDHPSPSNMDLLARRGVPILGDIDVLVEQHASARYVVGIGSPQVRRGIVERLDAAGLTAATLIHPSVTQGFDVTIGAGSVVCAGVRLTTNIRIGRHVHLNLNSTVGHDAILGDHVSTNPLASISGGVVIEAGVLLGVASVILQDLTLGRDAVVGGSACVVKNVEAGTTVKGIPAR